MRLPKRLEAERTRTVADHEQALTDLEAKDKLVDDLLETADGLVDELRLALVQVSAALHDPAGGKGDDDGR
jgi:hypothetical protein